MAAELIEKCDYIKDKVQKKKDISSQLEGDKKFTNININDESKYLIGNMRVFVKNITGETTLIEVGPSSTVKDLKDKIKEQKNIPNMNQRLIYNGNHLEDEKYLTDYNIKNESLIFLITYISNGMNVQVKCPSGKTLSFNIQSSDTVKDFKDKIEEKENIPSDHQSLIFNGNKLENERKISDYNIKDKSILHLISSYSSDVQVQVNTNSGRTITIDVDLSETVKSFKNKIEEKAGFPPSFLLFGGKQLEDANTLQYYNIQKNSTILSAERFDGGNIIHFIY